MEAVADGVYRIVREPARVANAYLVGDVLVDAITRWTAGYLLGQLAPAPLALVVLTHAHPDHQGAAARICRARGVPLACHEADVTAAEGRRPLLPHPLLDLAGRCWAGPPYPVARPLRDGDEVAGFQIIHAPGHTPGHLLLFRPADRLAICGDVLNNVSPLTGRVRLGEPRPWLSCDPARNRRSIRLLAALEPATVCFGHGPVLRDMDRLTAFVRRLPRDA
jgi:glyoxylase-like metal-dependent hydrolase (beta-lactamase superfamily II)